MGRKGGGGRGFVRAARRNAAAADAAQWDDCDEDGPKDASDQAAEGKLAGSESAQADAQKPAAAPLDDFRAAARAGEPEASSSGDEDDDAEEGGSETKGRMVQRHKKELRELKEKGKKAGKKAKDEYKALEDAMLARHELELKKFEVQQETKIPDSLYGDQDVEKKATKALKRRQKQQMLEASREEAIRAEVEEIGETDGAAEERLLTAALLPLGLQIHQIPADGNCMYRALAHQCDLLGLSDLIDNSKPETVGHSVLRAKAAQQMRDCPDAYLPFIIDDSDVDPHAQLREYCRKVESTAEWGTQVELQALAAALKVPIQIYNAAMPVVEMGAEHQVDGRAPLKVCYQQFAYGSGEHYNSVIPLKLSVASD